MNKESENALQLLTGKQTFGEVSPEELQQLADAHPYFAAAQLLLTQKMKQVQSGNLSGQLQKTALYFPNELWLCYLLTENKEEAIQPAATPDEQTGDISHGFIRIAGSKKLLGNELPGTEASGPVVIPEDNRAEKEAEQVSETEDTNLITLPAEQILEDIPVTGNISDEPEEAPLDDEELQEQSEELPLESASQKISSLLSGQAKEFQKPVAGDAELPAVAPEPLHTIDYFASQGIRLDPKREENTFDKKVHKFTDWLRQMKRINPQPVDLGTQTEEEQYVANIADSSNHIKKILTESMAEVLLKQGKRDKAIEIYQKLSLLNPDKSIYFAALIQNIK